MIRKNVDVLAIAALLCAVAAVSHVRETRLVQRIQLISVDVPDRLCPLVRVPAVPAFHWNKD